MPIPNQPSPYRPDPKIASLSDSIADPVAAADFPKTILRFRNDRAAATVGLDSLTDEDWLRHFGRFEPLDHNLPNPLALRYHGHQFRVYNPEIGDGRGFLFAQLRDCQDRLLDLGTKGSGTTRYSRRGDGRLTLKGGVREILATEMLEALGVDTSKTFSLVETGEQLMRGDEPSPTRSAVLVRLSHGHIRIGTFQRLAAYGDVATMERLIAYCLNNFVKTQAAPDAAAQLLHFVVERTAELAASYMVAGFVHGVLNSDNINVTGESFDYGPWRFTEFWDPRFTAAYFDESGLYAFGRQAEAIHWDVGQLAVSLRLLSEAPPLIEALERFPQLYQNALIDRFLWRLGVESQGEAEDRSLIESAERAMVREAIPIDRFFHEHRGGRADHPASYGENRSAFAGMLAGYQRSSAANHSYWDSDRPCSMLIDEVEEIWAAIANHDDWTPLHRKIGAIREMGEAHRIPA